MYAVVASVVVIGVVIIGVVAIGVVINSRKHSRRMLQVSAMGRPQLWIVMCEGVELDCMRLVVVLVETACFPKRGARSSVCSITILAVPFCPSHYRLDEGGH